MKRLSDANPTHDKLGDCLEHILREAGFTVCRDVDLVLDTNGRPLTDSDVLAFRDEHVYSFELKSNRGRLAKTRQEKNYRKVFPEGHFYQVFQEENSIYLIGNERNPEDLLFNVSSRTREHKLPGTINEYLEDAA